MSYVVWVLTKEVNAYDQYGEYFVAVFGCKPTHQQLSAFGVPTKRLRHVLNGGGWFDIDDECFHLKPHEVNNATGSPAELTPADVCGNA
jgi:hypothetical protein